MLSTRRFCGADRLAKRTAGPLAPTARANFDSGFSPTALAW